MQQDKEEANLAYNRILSWYTSAIYIYISTMGMQEVMKNAVYLCTVLSLLLFFK